MMKTGYFRHMLLVLGGLVLAMTACGDHTMGSDGNDNRFGSDEAAGQDPASRDSVGQTADDQMGGSVYLPEFIALEGDYIDYTAAWLAGETLCYLSMEEDEAAQYYRQCINTYSLSERVVSSYPLEWPDEPENIHLSEYVFAPDASMYALARSYSQDTPGSRDFLCRFDAQGVCLLLQDITENLREDLEDQTYISALKLDSKGRIYLLGNDAVWMYDKEGEFQGMVSPASSDQTGNIWINSLFPSAGDGMYISYTSAGSPNRSYTLAEIDFEKKDLKIVSTNFPGENQFSFEIENGLLMQDRSSLYVYDPIGQKEELLFSWMDCDIDGNNVLNFWQMENGNILAVVENTESRGGEIAMLVKVDEGQATEKENIILAVLSDGYNYQPEVVRFNRSSDQFHITIKEYRNDENGSAISREEALSKLYADIVSGDCPDIVELTGLDTENLSVKGALEDLMPYLEKSALLNADDFVEEILKAYTFDERLVCIPSVFFLETVMGDSGQVGQEPGWTLEELITMVESHPDAELFDGAVKEDILKFVMLCYEDAFIDWTTGECRFDSEAFRGLLEFVNRFPGEADSSPDRPTTPVRVQKGEVLLKEAWLYDFDSIQMDIEIFQGNATCIGFPSPDGRSRHMLSTGFSYAIPSKASHKDGAWSFIESFLAKECVKENYASQMGFPVVKRRLEEMIEKATRVEYILDENGEPLLDENGDPITLGGTRTTSSSDGWSYTYHTATMEEVDKILALLDGAVLTGGSDDEIMEIIIQEAEDFFAGHKTAVEVAEIIQNRINIYVNENR